MKVIRFPAFGEETCSPETLQDKVEIPSDPKTIINRKFIVLRNDNGKELVVVIGPIYTDGNRYYHSDIFGMVRNTNVLPGYSISGGGYVKLMLGGSRNGQPSWRATFCEDSGDYGVFDPEILTQENRDAIAATLKMTIEFKWVWWAQPPE